MNRRISRRHVLRGAGVGLLLPALPSLMKDSGAAAPAPKRFMPIYLPMGASQLWWNTTGSGAGANWQLSPLLSPFEPVKSKMLMVRQLGNFTWRSDLLTMNPAWTTYRERNDFCGVCRMPSGAFILPPHPRAASALLNCADGDAYRESLGLDPTSSPANVETVDQLIARSVPQETALASMQLGLLDGNGGLEERHSAMSTNMSWNQEGTPMGKDVNPRDVLDRLVAAGVGQGDPDPAVVEAAERRRALDLSALDAVEESTASLQPRLGQDDRARLDQYLTSLRDLEEETSNVTQASDCELIEVPGGVLEPERQAEVMNDLIVMALKCDATRIITYMLDNSRSDLVYSWVPRRDWENGGAELGGRSTGYHEAQNQEGTSPDYASITRWHIEVVADLVQKMDAVQEEDGTMLDNSVVLFLSGMHHSDHAVFDLPFLMFGSGGGTFRQDELVALPEAVEDIRQLRDVYYMVLNDYFGLGIHSFGTDMRGIPNAVIAEMLA